MDVGNVNPASPSSPPAPEEEAAPAKPERKPVYVDDTFSVGPFHFHHHALPAVFGSPYPTTPEARADRAKQINLTVSHMKLKGPQQSVLTDLTRLGVSPVDIWQGSHAVVKGDGGALYERWKALGAQPRTSSHYKDVPVQQFQLGFGTHALLFGKTAAGDTWFQFENHPDKPFNQDPVDFIEHRIDYVKYKITGENVGPLGFSPHSELNDPLQIAWRPLD